MASDAVRLSVLGPLGVSRGGAPVQLGGPRQQAVLGLLALHPNEVLHRDTIIEVLWRDDPPPSAAKMVQAYIGHLRRQLDPGRQPQDRDGVLISAGTHYRLQADGTRLDLIAFRQLAHRGHAARRSGDAATACALYAEALNLWEGDPLTDLDLLTGTRRSSGSAAAAPPSSATSPRPPPARAGMIACFRTWRHSRGAIRWTSERTGG